MKLLHCFILIFIGSTVLHADEVDNEDVNKDKRILLEDNYYTIVSKLDTLTADVANLKAQQDNVSKLDALTADVENVKAQLSECARRRVAFKAHLNKSLIPGTDQLIVFDDVRFNLGQAYHHGVFVAPYDGTYLFSVHMCSAGNHYINVHLLRNGAAIGHVLAGDTTYDACSSETTVTELQAGDDVTVQHLGNNREYIQGGADVDSSFTGALLF